ncbi:MAG: hypothetical protein HY694_05855 [Deltaproteobacteria bacterium]|nr:hypothetical protein [Deltaproteobacteria bacterium]
MRRLKASLTIAFVFVMAVLGLARADGPLTFVTSLSLGTNAHDIVLQGDFAYVVTDLGLTIIDISSPESPMVRGSVSTGRTLGLDVKGSYAYVASQRQGLRVIDISDPDAPTIIGSKSLPGNTWDVAVKDNIAYVASFAGELYLINVTVPSDPRRIKVLGLLAWGSAGHDAANLQKLNNYVTSGNAKVTGVAISGDHLVSVDWSYGRLYWYDVADAANPVFKGTHYVPFPLRAEVDADRKVIYMVAAFGHTSGIYSVPMSAMEMASGHSTRHETCSSCGYFKSLPTDYAGLGVVPGGNYVLYVAGKQGRVGVLDVTDPADIQDAGSLPIGRFGVRGGDSLGVQSRGDYIFVAAGALGLRVYSYPGLSD